MYANAKYVVIRPSTEPNAISVEIDGVPSFVPLDPENIDYMNIMTLVDEGKLVIQPADGVE